MPSVLTTAEKVKFRKRLIVGCDGSWQTSDQATGNVSSNVTNMCRALSHEAKIGEGEAIQQIIYYQSGVGTSYLTSLASQLGGK